MHTSSADPPEGRPHLQTRALAAGYGGAAVITGIAIDVALGETVTIIGPNGAGKSTLLRAITGRIPAMEGSVLLEQQPIHQLREDERVRLGIGYVPQTRDVFENLTARENLEMGGFLLPRKKRAQRIAEVIEIFPLLASLLPRTAAKLSGGERKLLAIARVLMLQPTLLILDEPTANLAPLLATEVLNHHVPSLTAENLAILLVEQRAREALEVSQRGYVMVDGRIHLSGPSKRLLARPDIREVFLGQIAS
jgi:ABC-type branched-subunit amino acid transport system ATPase component